MSDIVQGSRASTQELPSAQENKDSQNATGDELPSAHEPTKSISYETQRRLLSENKKLKEIVAAKEREDAEAKQKAIEENGQYKSAFELEKKKAVDLEQKLNQKDKMISDAIKMRAFLTHIPGTIPDDYWDFIKLDDIILDPDTNKVDQVALENYAKDWMQKHSRLIDKTSSAKVPTEAPKVTNLGQVNLTIADMAKKLAGLKQ